MKKNLCALLLTTVIVTPVSATEKVSLMLDWYLNPDHAPVIVAEQIGAFKEEGLEVEIVPPSDPSLPPRLVAAKKADFAITYQPQLHFFADQGLPLVRVGTLVNTPLNTIITLDKTIASPADLKGKKIGYSVSGIEEVTLGTMLKNQGLTLADVRPVNVNFQLSGALLAGQVDAVIGGYRNIEALELQLQGKEPVVFNIEDYGIPAYDELIIVANRDDVAQPKTAKLLAALKKGHDYLQAHPEETWKAFASSHPELNSELNHQAWLKTLPLFASNPAHLDTARYQAYEQFLFDNELIKHITPIEKYAIEIK